MSTTADADTDGTAEEVRKHELCGEIASMLTFSNHPLEKGAMQVHAVLNADRRLLSLYTSSSARVPVARIDITHCELADRHRKPQTFVLREHGPTGSLVETHYFSCETEELERAWVFALSFAGVPFERELQAPKGAHQFHPARWTRGPPKCRGCHHRIFSRKGVKCVLCGFSSHVRCVDLCAPQCLKAEVAPAADTEPLKKSSSRTKKKKSRK